MITLRPVGGLCNRLLCISSFFSFCEEIDAELEIYWWKNDELKAYFTELFEPITNVSIKWTLIESEKLQRLHSDRILDLPKQRFYNKLLKAYQRLFYKKVFHAQDIKNLIDSEYDFRELKKHKNIYLTFWGPIGSYSFKKELFVPKRELATNFPPVSQKKYVGLHIRRSDHTLVMRETPIEKYHRVIDQEITKDRFCSFYVASDDATVKKDLKAKYGNRIMTLNEENASRDSLTGMQGAMADLFTLSTAEKIYGSPKSTFALVGAYLGGIELIDISQC